MKLSHLSLAILSAIALSACGGGSDSGTPVKDPDPKPEVTPDKDKDQVVTDEEKIVDPAQTGVVGKLDFKKESSVGTLQYIRDEESRYDRKENPTEATSATSILGVTLNKQNPYLTNIALARQLDKNGNVKVVQYMGNDEHSAPKIEKPVSLQQQNKHNVSVLGDNAAGRLTQTSTAAPGPASEKISFVPDETLFKEQLENVEEIIKIYKNNEKTLNQDDKETYASLKEVYGELKDVVAAVKKSKNGLYTGLAALPVVNPYGDPYPWGDYVRTADSVINTKQDQTSGGAAVTAYSGRTDPEGNKVAGYPASPNVATGPGAIGLVGIQYQGFKKAAGPEVKEIFVQGTEEKSKSSTRIFGRNYNIRALKATQNSYEGPASVILSNGGITKYTKPTGSDLSHAKGATPTSNTELAYTLAVKPMKLENVQYGRVTGNLDPVELNEEQKKSRSRVYTFQPYLNKGDEKAVDTYFYRGPNATTLDQMAKLPAGKELTYRGHALMYGIDNSYHGGVSNEVPNAFGAVGSYALGNFVQAILNVDKKTVKGSVYNAWHEGKKDVGRDTLVTFAGNVHGNTVIGEAERVYNKSDKADFRASFFGKEADEMGGSINSTTWQERYGAQGDVWGGVFGTKRVTTITPEDELYNYQLGDIPEVGKQQPAKKTSETETPKAE